jgi:hypothetical protein
MPNYLLAYHGGGMPDTEEEQAKSGAAWAAWLQQLGPALVDGGNPVAFAKTLRGDADVKEGGGANPVSGYSIIAADDMNIAIDLTKDCPHLEFGGTVEVCETLAVM